MLIAIIDTRDNPAETGATLGPLVRGVVEGVIGSAVLIVSRRDPVMDELADAAGCRVIVAASWAEGFARAVAGAGNAGTLVLDAGIRLPSEFWPVLVDALPVLGSRPAATRADEPGGLAWLVAQISAPFSPKRGRVGRDHAILLPPSRARELAAIKADPFAIRYGKALVSLETRAARVVLGAN